MHKKQCKKGPWLLWCWSRECLRWCKLLPTHPNVIAWLKSGVESVESVKTMPFGFEGVGVQLKRCFAQGGAEKRSMSNVAPILQFGHAWTNQDAVWQAMVCYDTWVLE